MITTFKRLEIAGKKIMSGYYFNVLYTPDGKYLRKYNKKTEKGIERYNVIIGEILKLDPYVVIVELFEPANNKKGFANKPITRRIQFKDPPQKEDEKPFIITQSYKEQIITIVSKAVTGALTEFIEHSMSEFNIKRE